MQTCLYAPVISPWLLLLPKLPHCPVCLCVHLTFHLCNLISLFNVIKSSHACLCALFVSLLLYIHYQPAHMFVQICVCLLFPFCVLCLYVTHVFSSCLLICLLCCSLISFPCLFYPSAVSSFCLFSSLPYLLPACIFALLVFSNLLPCLLIFPFAFTLSFTYGIIFMSCQLLHPSASSYHSVVSVASLFYFCCCSIFIACERSLAPV